MSPCRALASFSLELRYPASYKHRISHFRFQWKCCPDLPERRKLQSPLLCCCSQRRSLKGPCPLPSPKDQCMLSHAERQRAQCRPCRPLFRLLSTGDSKHTWQSHGLAWIFFFPTPKTNDLWKTQARESQTIRIDTRHFTSSNSSEPQG